MFFTALAIEEKSFSSVLIACVAPFSTSFPVSHCLCLCLLLRLSIADAYPLLHVAFVAFNAAAPLKSTATALGSSLLDLAVATPTAEGGAAIAGCGVAIAFATHSAWNRRQRERYNKFMIVSILFVIDIVSINLKLELKRKAVSSTIHQMMSNISIC